MAAKKDPNLGINYGWALGEDNWKDGMDANLLLLGAILNLQVTAIQNAPPTGTLTNGMRYIVGTAPTGAWAGKANQVAVLVEASWTFWAPKAGWCAQVESTATEWLYTGTAWQNKVAAVADVAAGTAPDTLLASIGGVKALIDIAGVGAYLNNTANLNNATKNGFFAWNNTSTNAPVASSYGRGYTIASDANNATQYGIVNATGAMYVRFLTAGAWSAWAKVGASSASDVGALPVRGNVGSNSDLNTLGPTQELFGVWYISASADLVGLTNAPEAVGAVVEVFNGGQFYGTQRFTTFRGAIYTRSLTARWNAASPSWSPWTMVGVQPIQGYVTTDFNAITSPGTWSATSTALNSPLDLATSWIVEVELRLSANSLLQRATTVVTTANLINRVFVRTLSGSTWSAWAEVYTSGSKPTAVDVGALPLSTSALGTTDLNILGDRASAGVYLQSADANATPARNYPESKAGTMMITPSAYNGCQQTYITINGNIWTRSLSGSWAGSGPWNAWVKQSWYLLALDTTTNLGTLRAAGIYSQGAVSGATLANGYPVAGGNGVLEVLPGGDFGLSQRYTTRFGSVWFRGLSGPWNGTDGPWKEWQQISGVAASNAAAIAGTDPTLMLNPVNLKAVLDNFGLGSTYLNSLADLNTARTNNSFAWINTSANSPVAGSYGRGITIASDATNVTQIGIINDTGAMYVRYLTGTTWSAWISTTVAALPYLVYSNPGTTPFSAAAYTAIPFYTSGETAGGITLTSNATITVPAAGLYDFELEVRVNGGATNMPPVGTVIGLSIDTTTAPTALRAGYSAAQAVDSVTILRLHCRERLAAGATRRAYLYNAGAAAYQVVSAVIKVTRVGA